jgi:hypothetical protein
MSYLQLADQGSTITKNYIHIPAHISSTGSSQLIREDFFDILPDSKYYAVMENLEPYQLSEGLYLQDKASRQARRDSRKTRKTTKQEQKQRRAEAKTIIREKKASGEMKTTGENIKEGLTGVLDTVSNIFGGGQVATEFEIESGQKPSFEFGYKGGTKATWIPGIENWIVIAGGGVILLGGLYFLTKKK